MEKDLLIHYAPRDVLMLCLHTMHAEKKVQFNVQGTIEMFCYLVFNSEDDVLDISLLKSEKESSMSPDLDAS